MPHSQMYEYTTMSIVLIQVFVLHVLTKGCFQHYAAHYRASAIYTENGNKATCIFINHTANRNFTPTVDPDEIQEKQKLSIMQNNV